MSSAVGHPDEIQDTIYKLQSIFRPSSKQSLLSNCQNITCKVERLSLASPPLRHYKVNFPDDLSKIHTTIYKILEYVLTFGCNDLQVVIFVPTREVALTLHASVLEQAHDVEFFHAALTGKVRDLMVYDFNQRFIQALITTDALLPPEFDQSMVHVVINWEMPKVCDSLEEEEPDVALYSQRLCPKGAVFNFLCGERDNMVMKKFESRCTSKVSEVSSWASTADFKMALEEAGLV